MDLIGEKLYAAAKSVQKERAISSCVAAAILSLTDLYRSMRRYLFHSRLLRGTERCISYDNKRRE